MSPLTVNEDAVMSMQTDIDLGLKRWSLVRHNFGHNREAATVGPLPPHSREAGATSAASNPGAGNIRSLGKNWV